MNRPRGLCWSCYYRPGVLERYPSTSKFAHRGLGNRNANSLPLGAPTMALPGTPEKMAVLSARLFAGLALWHPQDGGD